MIVPFHMPTGRWLCCLMLCCWLVAGAAVWGQDRDTAPKWEYLAVSLGPHEGEATKRLNELASSNWEYVGPLGHNLVAFRRAQSRAVPATVSGRVTLDGQPLESGVIRFVPADGKGAPTEGVIKDGKYEVRPPVGSVRVEIRSPEKKQDDAPAPRPAGAAPPERLPPKYHAKSTLQAEIRDGKNQLDFELQGR